jgi:hypothetical protein
MPDVRLELQEASMTEQVNYEIEITRGGMWPTVWKWSVRTVYPAPYASRYGDAITKDRARRKALKAKRSMERDDVRVIYS